MDACARDVEALETTLGLHADAVLGHSFGGKVALLRAGHGTPPSQIWVADSTLRVGEPSGTAWKVVEIVDSLPDVFDSREQLADAMVAEGYARGVGQWLGMNLERGEGGFRWKLDWKGVESMLRDYFATDVWPIVENPPAETDLHLIRATRSDAIDAESARRIEAAGERTGRVHLHSVEAGHWLNVDNPDAVLALLEEQLP